QEAPITGVPLSDVEPFLRNLNVVDSFEDLPYVVGLEDNRLRASSGQKAYVVGLDAAQPGQRYMVVRPTVRFAQPKPTEDLDSRGKVTPGSGNLWSSYVASSDRKEVLGYELAKVNVGTLTQVASGDVEASTLQLEDSGSE